MTTLKNGSILLLETLTPVDGSSIVLAKTETAFATWRKAGDGNTYHGHYFQQTVEGLTEAIDDFRTRVLEG